MKPMFSIREIDEQARLQFEAACYRVGQGMARKAFKEALNSETGKARTRVRWAVRKQAGVANRVVVKQIRMKPAKERSLQAELYASGRAVSLKEFAHTQGSYGVTAKVWNRSQLFESTFKVSALGGHVFKRRFRTSTKDRLPIAKLWGPIIPREMMKERPVKEFEVSTDDVARIAMEKLQRLMKGG